MNEERRKGSPLIKRGSVCVEGGMCSVYRTQMRRGSRYASQLATCEEMSLRKAKLNVSLGQIQAGSYISLENKLNFNLSYWP